MAQIVDLAVIRGLVRRETSRQVEAHRCVEPRATCEKGHVQEGEGVRRWWRGRGSDYAAQPRGLRAMADRGAHAARRDAARSEYLDPWHSAFVTSTPGADRRGFAGGGGQRRPSPAVPQRPRRRT